MGSKTDKAHERFLRHSHNTIDKFRAARKLADKGVPWEEVDGRTVRLVSTLLAEARTEMEAALKCQSEYLRSVREADKR